MGETRVRGCGERHLMTTLLIGERERRLYPLDPEKIDYIESDGNYVSIRSGNTAYISRDSIKRLFSYLHLLSRLHSLVVPQHDGKVERILSLLALHVKNVRIHACQVQRQARRGSKATQQGLHDLKESRCRLRGSGLWRAVGCPIDPCFNLRSGRQLERASRNDPGAVGWPGYRGHPLASALP